MKTRHADESGREARRLALLLYDNRSGSTLLSAMLDGIPGVVVSQETDLIPAVLEYSGSCDGLADLPNLEGFLERETRVPELGVPTPLLADLEPSGSDIPFRRQVIDHLLDRYFVGRLKAEEASLWVVKGPRLHYHLTILLELYPDLRLVHIVRDGRAVFASKSRTPSRSGSVMDRNPVRAALKWTKKLAIVERFGGSVCEVRYEDVVRNPQDTLRRLCECLGVDVPQEIHDSAPSDFYRRIPEAYRSLHANLHKSPDPRHVDRWRDEVKTADLAVYERLAGPWLRKMGYELRMEAVRRPGPVRTALCELRWRCAYLVDVLLSPLRWWRSGESLRSGIARKWHEGRAAFKTSVANRTKGHH